MSRFSEGYDDDPFPNAGALWQHNIHQALTGKRGRKALAELREALLALPEKRLIGGAMCTAGPADRRPKPYVYTTIRGEVVDDDDGRRFDKMVATEGEGVCAVGAYIWWKKVKAGADPQRAFTDLPTIWGEADGGIDETARIGSRDAGLAMPLAWELAYKNDETFESCTPEERYVKFLAWIDSRLALDSVSVAVEG